MNLGDRVALVTGGAHRVGAALTLALAARGMRTALHYNTARREAEETAERARDGGAEVEVFQADLTAADAPHALVARVVERFGSIDVLINSAAVMLRTPVDEVTPAQWDDIFALNLRAPFFLSRAAFDVMRKSGGAIVNISDLAAFEIWSGYIPHAITKAGILKMTETLARVFAPSVRVNAIAPGAVLMPENWPAEESERFARTTPLGRLGDPQDVVDAMLYLLHADFITGETIVVDGGRRIRH